MDKGDIRMDTGSHTIMGLSLAGLAAALDPHVTADAGSLAAAIAGIVLGSHAPDLDTAAKLRSSAAYIRHHRGFSHSMLLLPLWAAVLTAGIAALAGPLLPLIHLYGWILLAVMMHVLSDSLSSYGAMALWPWSRQHLAWNVLHLFDPVLFTVQTAAVLLWAFQLAAPEAIFPPLYAGIAGYCVWRAYEHRRKTRLVVQLDGAAPENIRYYLLVPTLSRFDWNVVRKNGDGSSTVGSLKKDKLTWLREIRHSRHEAVEASKATKEVKALLSITSCAYAEVIPLSWGWEVRWSDVRYRRRSDFPLAAIVVMDANFRPAGSFVGWIGDDKLQRLRSVVTY